MFTTILMHLKSFMGLNPCWHRRAEQLGLSVEWKMQMRSGDSDECEKRVRHAGEPQCYKTIQLQNTAFDRSLWRTGTDHTVHKQPCITDKCISLGSLHGIKPNHRLCHIICVKLQEKYSNIWHNGQCLFGNNGWKKGLQESMQMYLSGGWRNGQRKWSLIFVLEQKDLDDVDLSHSASAACWVYLSAAHNISWEQLWLI